MHSNTDEQCKTKKGCSVLIAVRMSPNADRVLLAEVPEND